MIKPGMIGFSNNKNGLVPKLIRIVTKSDISHTFITTTDIAGVLAVQEAGMMVQIVPFKTYYKEKESESYSLYEIVSEYASEEQKQKSLSIVFTELAGANYGKFQLLWFVWRGINNLFGKDIRHEKNWFTDGVICSELVYMYLYNLGPVFQEFLRQFNPDTIQAQDVLDICKANPHIFKLIEEKN